MTVSELIDLLAQHQPDLEVAVEGGIITGVANRGPAMIVLTLEFA